MSVSYGRPLSTRPWRMSVASSSGFASPSMFTRWTFEIAGVKGMLGTREAATIEPNGTVVLRRPALRCRESIGGVVNEVFQEPLVVWRQRQHAVRQCRWPDRRQAILTNQHHPNQLIAPACARQDVGRWKQMARRAQRPRIRFGRRSRRHLGEGRSRRRRSILLLSRPAPARKDSDAKNEKKHHHDGRAKGRRLIRKGCPLRGVHPYLVV